MLYNNFAFNESTQCSYILWQYYTFVVSTVHVCITTAVLYYKLSAALLCSPLATLAYINSYSHLDKMIFA